LNHLLRLPIEIVKMTPQMTIAATGNGRQLAMVQSLIHVCKAVGVQVLAQGIETKEQIKALHALGCELGQGNLLSPALDAPHAQQLASRLHRSPDLPFRSAYHAPFGAEFSAKFSGVGWAHGAIEAN
jgi:EAL domain-containing protein (putative c-di-GMP-specific phosphodiesterase class I)